MTQVWMVRNSDTDIHLFNRLDHVKESVKISYSSCINVKIEEQIGGNEAIFLITGSRYDKARDAHFEFAETVTANRYPVWTEPCHL